MAAAIRAMSRAQKVGITAAAATGLAFYFKSKFSAAKEVDVPPDTLLARVLPPPASGIKVGST
jgi:hypothetical protein